MVQPAELLDQRLARPQRQMIGVGQNERRTDLAQVTWGQHLDSGQRAYWSVIGRWDVTVGCVQDARARLSITGDDLKFEAHQPHFFA